MNPEDEQSDDLEREYRRASAVDAGRPTAATRAAILAEARAAALRRAPAANDSRVWWRAVAGVAMLGVGVLIWRQVDRPVAPLAPPASVATADTAADAAAQLPSPPQLENASIAQAKARAPVAPAAPTAAQSAGAASGAVASAAASAAAERRERSDERASVAQTFDTSRPPAPSLSAAPPTQTLGRNEAARLDATALLQQRFPVELASPTPARALWVLQDESGDVLRSGRLGDDEAFTAVTQRLQPEFPGRRIGPWNVTPVTNAQGVAVQLGVAIVR